MKTIARFLAVLALIFAAGAAQAAQGSRCVPTTGTVSGLQMAVAVNTALNSIDSMNSGSSAPTNNCAGAAVIGSIWLDTSTTPNVVRIYDGSSTWLAVGYVDATNHIWAPPVGGTAGSVTAASTTNLCTSQAAYQVVAGATTITSFGSSCLTGQIKFLTFSGAPQITYNAASMILPTGASLTMAANYNLAAVYLGGGNWRVLWVTKSDGTALATTTTFTSNTIFTGSITPTALAVSTDNWNPTGIATAAFINASASSAVDLTGIVAQTAGTHIFLYNGGLNTITLKDEATSTAANRFGLGADFPLAAKQSVLLRYDSATSRWIMLSSSRQLASNTQCAAGTDTTTVTTPACVAAGIAALVIAPTNTQTFTTPGANTWTKPSGTTASSVTTVSCWSGGGSGGHGQNGGRGGAGGGGGAHKLFAFLTSTLGATETVTIGAGGAAQTVNNTAGNAGGTTSFGAWLSILGGCGGLGTGATISGGGGAGQLSACSISVGGGPSGGAIGVDSALGGGGGGDGGNGGGDSGEGGAGGGGGSSASSCSNGGDAVDGGAGGGGTGQTGTACLGGDSDFGGDGGDAHQGGTPGDPGAQPGGAGGGSENVDSGAGGAGECVVSTFK